MGPVTAKAQDAFTFDGQSTSANFLASGTVLTADNNAARTATFTVSSPGGNDIAFDFEDNGSVAAPNFGTNLNGPVLAAISGTPASDTLTLTFDQAITSLTADFAITDFGGAYLLTLAGGSATDTEGGTLNATSANYEGTLSITGAAFTSATFTFSGPATSYALDGITVTPAATAVPEPGTVAFALALGLPAAWQMRRKLARK